MADKPVQYFTDEYLERCRDMSPLEIIKFLDDFRNLQSLGVEKSKLISIKIPPSLLESFKTKARLNGVPYQTKIKELMKEWVEG